MHRRSTKRNKVGATTVALVLVIAFCGILPLGLLGFELVRFFVIQEELRNISDSSALAGTAAMASAPSAPAINPGNGLPYTYGDREFIAMTVAAQTFAQNTILETAFGLPKLTDPSGDGTPSSAVVSGSPNVTVNLDPNPASPATPAVYNATINVVLLATNPVTGVNTQVPLNTPASVIQIQAYYSDRPLFLGHDVGTWNFGVTQMNHLFTVSAISNGGLPSVDLMLVMDLSGSMDDSTPVALVDRFWDPVGNKMQYAVVVADTIYNIFLPPDTGTQINAFFPQNLDYADYPSGTGTDGPFGNNFPYIFSESLAPPTGANTISANTVGLRADNIHYTTTGGTTMPEAGLPPGNVKNTLLNQPVALAPYPVFTDMVVLPTGSTFTKGASLAAQEAEGTTTFGSGSLGAFPTITGTTKSFTNIAQLVEASRGNLDAETGGTLSQATNGQYTGSFMGITPAGGYYNAYWLYVLQQETPISQSQSAAYDFFQTMHLSANSHFGLETFAATQATLAGGQFETAGPYPNIGSTSSNYLPNYKTTFPFPCISLSQTADNYNIITDSLLPLQVTSFPPANPDGYVNGYPLLPQTSTDIADSLNVAISVMASTSVTRPTAKKAIILFTDGVPNEPTDPTTGYNDAIAAAQQAGASTPPIPIYTIGLSTNTNIAPAENDLLGDGSPGIPQGVAYDSDPNIAKYYNVTNPANLEQAFQTIARSLCVIN
jgi:hypothetical protein